MGVSAASRAKYLELQARSNLAACRLHHTEKTAMAVALEQFPDLHIAVLEDMVAVVVRSGGTFSSEATVLGVD